MVMRKAIYTSFGSDEELVPLAPKTSNEAAADGMAAVHFRGRRTARRIIPLIEEDRATGCWSESTAF